MIKHGYLILKNYKSFVEYLSHFYYSDTYMIYILFYYSDIYIYNIILLWIIFINKNNIDVIYSLIFN